MSSVPAQVAALRSRAPTRDCDPHFATDILGGLALPQKTTSATWLYDRRGCELFEAITRLSEYYPTRTEVRLLAQCAPRIAEMIGPQAVVFEIGSGSSRKTPLLLAALQRPHAYVPIDIAAQFLRESAAALRDVFPELAVVPLVADFTRALCPPPSLRLDQAGRRLVFFPGSTIGNLAPTEAVACLRRLKLLAGDDGLLVIGADANQDEATLIPAYDDADGVTARFNLNLLARINRELAGDFDIAAFRHEARYNRSHKRIEMHLVSLRAHNVTVLDRRFSFRRGESIHTESSYKYDPAEFDRLAHAAGLKRRAMWADPRYRFGIHVLAADADSAAAASPAAASDTAASAAAASAAAASTEHDRGAPAAPRTSPAS